MQCWSQLVDLSVVVVGASRRKTRTVSTHDTGRGQLRMNTADHYCHAIGILVTPKSFVEHQNRQSQASIIVEAVQKPIVK
jgi:hypothetical protein